MFKQPIIIESDFFLRKMSIFFDVAGMMLFPFLIIKTYPEPKTRGESIKYAFLQQRLIHHEKIHFYQYKELLVVGFLFVYLFDWVHGLIKYRNFTKAFMRIRMEQEAYEHQSKFFFRHEHANILSYKPEEYIDYCDRREKFAWRKYKV